MGTRFSFSSNSDKKQQKEASGKIPRGSIAIRKQKRRRTAVTSKAPKDYTDYDANWENKGAANFRTTQQAWLSHDGTVLVQTSEDSWPFNVKGGYQKQKEALLKEIEHKRALKDPVQLGTVIEFLLPWPENK